MVPVGGRGTWSAPLLLLELALRLLGIGHDLSLIVPVANATGWYRLNPNFDESFFGQVDLLGPEQRPFQLPKPRGRRRILVVGGSSVVGFPYPAEFSFSRHLEFVLANQSDGDETMEVLNAGIVSISSSTEVAVVEEGLAVQPDVIVVYTGHNEFYGPGGVASSVGSTVSPGWFRFAASWRRLYLVQAIRNLMRPRTPTRDLIEALPGDLHIGYETVTFRKAVARLRENLSNMASLAARAHVPIVFVSPVPNEHDQPPIENLHADPKQSEEGWRAKLRLAERELTSGSVNEAIVQLDVVRSERDRDPGIRFRLAQACEKAGRTNEAIDQYAAALDLDGCRFRAPTQFRAVMADVAEQHHKSGAVFIDLHAAICQDSAIAVPGQKHLLEHVHFTWEGNRFVGIEIAKSIWSDVWARPWSNERILDEPSTRKRLGLLDEDQIAACVIARLFYTKPPFRDGIDAEKLAKDLFDESMLVFRRLPSDRRGLFEERSEREMSPDLLGELIRACRSSKNDVLLELLLRARVKRQPWDCEASAELTSLLRKWADPEEADRIRDEARKWPCPK